LQQSDSLPAGPTRTIRVVARVVILAIAVFQAWAQRYAVSPDGISYLDMSDAVVDGNWSRLVNLYWSPLYPALIGVAERAASLTPLYRAAYPGAPKRSRGGGGNTEMPLIESDEAARRLARAIASDLSLYNEEKIVRGIEGDSLFEELSDEKRFLSGSSPFDMLTHVVGEVGEEPVDGDLVLGPDGAAGTVGDRACLVAALIAHVAGLGLRNEFA